MTKKDYIKAAKIVQRIYSQDQAGIVANAVERAFVELFSGDNPAFDRERFVDACREPKPVKSADFQHAKDAAASFASRPVPRAFRG